MFGSGPSAFGSPPLSITAGITSLLLVRSNPTRMRISIINDSDTIVYLTRGESARLNTGIRLNAHGGSLIDEPDTLGRLYTGPWSVISSAAGKNICVSEE